MNSSLLRTLTILLLCFTFVGQVMANTVMSYHMVAMHSDSQSGNHDMTSASHKMPMSHHGNNHAMHQDKQAEASATEQCCDTSCYCLTTACSSLAAMVDGFNQNTPVVQSASIANRSNLAISQYSSSLYRPPIFA